MPHHTCLLPAAVFGNNNNNNNNDHTYPQKAHQEQQAQGGEEEGEIGPPPLQWHHIYLVVGLFLGYASLMFSRAALDVAIPLMVSDETTGLRSAEEIGSMLVMCSFSYLLGKLSTGFGVDYFGARFIFLWVSSFSASALTGLFGLAHGIGPMKVLWAAVCICQSSGWAAMTSIVSSHLPSLQYGLAFSVLSTSSRVGDVTSKLLLGRFTSQGASWRSLFFIASALQAAIALLNFMIIGSPSLHRPTGEKSATTYNNKYDAEEACLALANQEGDDDDDGPKKKQSHPLDKATVCQAIFHALSSMRFWYITLGVASLHAVMELDKYMPLYLHKSLNMDPGPAAQAASLYPLSQLISLVLASMYYDKLNPVARLFTICGLTSLVFLFFVIQLGLLTYGVWLTHTWVYLVIIFLAGFCLSVPYYLPASLFILEAGGKRHCILDSSGGLAAMLFHLNVGSLASADRWPSVLCLISLSSLTGLFCMAAFQYANISKDDLLRSFLNSVRARALITASSTVVHRPSDSTTKRRSRSDFSTTTTSNKKFLHAGVTPSSGEDEELAYYFTPPPSTVHSVTLSETLLVKRSLSGSPSLGKQAFPY